MKVRAVAICLAWLALVPAHAETIVTTPFRGVTHIRRTESEPRPVTLNIVLIKLATPGLRFELTPPGGSRETVRQTTADFLEQEHAQIAINAHFFLPYPSDDSEAFLVGLAASEGRIYSAFEAPIQPYAIVSDAPALNIDKTNHAEIVTRDPDDPEGFSTASHTPLWTAISGSARIITEGQVTIPQYLDSQHSTADLIPGGPARYSNADSWYERLNARTIVGLTRDRGTLVLFTVDRAQGSLGLTVTEAATLLAQDYGVWDALNLDGGGSTTLVMEDAITHRSRLINAPSEVPEGRAVGSNLAIFAEPLTHEP